MNDIKYYFESTIPDEVFETDSYSSNAIIESIYVDCSDMKGFDIFLVDEELNVELGIISTTMTNTGLLIKLSEKQKLRIISKGNGKILLQGKLF